MGIISIGSSVGQRLAIFAVGICTGVLATAAPVQLVSSIDSPQNAPAGGSGDSWAPVMSPDGRYVLFASTANNLVLNSNGNPIAVYNLPRLNVFLRDRTNGTTTLVSANLAGTGGGNDNSLPVEISTNGRYALFESSASDLVPADTNGVSDIFIRDLWTGTTSLVSVSTNGGTGNGASRSSVMTPDGHFAAFVSTAADLVPDDTNRIPDVFVRDLQLGGTVLVSVGAVSTNAAVPIGGSEAPDITPDGRYVAFYSTATNLVAGVRTVGDIYVRDLIAGTTVWASANARALLGTAKAISYNHAISEDGNLVVFEASTNQPAPSSTRGIILRFNAGTGLTEVVHTNANVATAAYEDIRSLTMTPDGRFVAFVANTNGTSGNTTCIYAWDGLNSTLTLVSADLSNAVPVNSTCDWPVIDPSGRYVAFLSNATNIVTNTMIGDFHMYHRDILTGLTSLVDVDTNGIGSGVGAETVPALSADGRLVAFEGLDADIVPNDRNHDYDLFLRDVGTATTELLSARHPGMPSLSPNGMSTMSVSSVSADGRFVAFASDADNLAANDTNGCRDVFVRDRVIGTNFLVSLETNNLRSAAGPSTDSAISADGRYVAFTSKADNLAGSDTNKAEDVFLRDLQTASTLLVSARNNGPGSGNAASYSPILSSDGRFVLFRSKANNLAAGSFSGSENLFVRDMQSATTYALTSTGVLYASMTRDGRFIASVDTAGASSGKTMLWDTQLATPIYTNISGTGILGVAVSPDGNRIACWAGSNAVSLMATDRTADTNWVIASGFPSSRSGLQFSADGRFLAYSARPTSSGTNQVYLYDFQSSTNFLVSRNFGAGAPGNGHSDSPVISPDGRFVAYRSAATNLVTGDSNDVPDVFLFDRLAASTALMSQGRFSGSSGDNRSLTPVFSGSGQNLLWQSWASDLTSSDFNHNADLFAFTLFYATILPGTNIAEGPTISWPAAPGQTYHVQFKNTLSDNNWQEVSGTVTTIGGTDYLTDLAPAAGQRFYRVVGF